MDSLLLTYKSVLKLCSGQRSPWKALNMIPRLDQVHLSAGDFACLIELIECLSPISQFGCIVLVQPYLNVYEDFR